MRNRVEALDYLRYLIPRGLDHTRNMRKALDYLRYLIPLSEQKFRRALD